jgi:hypothetical protein
MGDLRGAIGFSLYKKGGFFGLLARAIRFFTHGKWSHTFVVIGKLEGTDEYLVSEADEFGVNINLFSKYLDEATYNFELYEPKTFPANIDVGIQECLKLEGTIYGYFQLIGFIIVWLVKQVTGKKIKNPIGGGIVCSEEVLRYCLKLNIAEAKFKALDEDSTSPKDLYVIIKPEPDFVLIKKQGA